MKYLLFLIFLLLPATGLAQPLWSVEKGLATVDHGLLDKVIAETITQFNISVAGEDYSVDVDKVRPPNLGVRSISGFIDDDQGSFFLMCRTENMATVAFFKTRDGLSYRLDHTSGENQIHEVDSAEFGSCGGGLEYPKLNPKAETEFQREAGPRSKRDGSRSLADDGSLHDILMGYTPRAETVMGGLDFIRAECQLAVDAANLVYENSNITSELRLVHIMPVDYSENTAWDYEDHVDYLWFPDDGHMDEMLDMRNLVGADFVSVLIDGRNTLGDITYCGAAYLMEPGFINQGFESGALSVVSVQCATPNWTLAHEVGHNRGCSHDRDNSDGGAYPYSFGHLFAWNEGTQTGLRTVMAYDNQETQYERVPHFSNPEVSFAGHPTGIWPGYVGEAHNALTHENTSAICALFRYERTFVDFSTNWSTPDGSLIAPYSNFADAFEGSREGGHIVIHVGIEDFSGILTEKRSFVSDAENGVVLGGPPSRD